MCVCDGVCHWNKNAICYFDCEYVIVIEFILNVNEYVGAGYKTFFWTHLNFKYFFPPKISISFWPSSKVESYCLDGLAMDSDESQPLLKVESYCLGGLAMDRDKSQPLSKVESYCLDGLATDSDG